MYKQKPAPAGFLLAVNKNLNTSMMVSKITEVTVFESPDGGRTVYARRPGSATRDLHWQDPNLQQELKELENQKRWVDIFQARNNNPELDRLCEQVELLYELGKKSE
jgi:hypothetical protein